MKQQKQHISLCQYYDQQARRLGYKDWNTMSADIKEDGKSTEWYKKQMKQDYKKLVASANAEED
nr:MAG: hypothetical protein [Microvirus sp.]